MHQCKRQIWEDKPLTCMHEFLAFCIISGLIVISSCPKECQFGNGISHLERQIEAVMKVHLDRQMFLIYRIAKVFDLSFKLTPNSSCQGKTKLVFSCQERLDRGS